jgi:hypothetical protein
VLVVDPLVELHSLTENDNGEMRQVLAQIRSWAKRFNMAVLVVHHSRKAGGEGAKSIAGDADAARGGGSLNGAVRVNLSAVGMTEAEAQRYGMTGGAHEQYVRIDGAKANLSAKVKTQWLQKVVYDLENGDDAVSPEPWIAPPPKLTDETLLATIVEAVKSGSPDGPWSAHLSKDDRSVKHLLEQHGVVAPAQHSETVRALKKDHGLSVQTYKDAAGYRKNGLMHESGAPARFEWIIAEAAVEDAEED